MILFGRKAHHLGLQAIEEEKCVKCGNNKQVISLFQKYFHILWLPMFPIKRAAASQCFKCRNVETEKVFSDYKKSVVLELKKKHSAPFWTFAGLFILILLFGIKFLLR